jgi:membrane protease YdiL (CAAX protease family)
MRARRALQAGFLFILGIGVASAAYLAAATLGAGVRPLALAGLGIEAGLVSIAVAGALLASWPLRDSLGLRRSLLSRGRLALLVLGTLALSHGLDCLLALSGLREHSALEAFERTLAGARGIDLALALGAMAIAPALGEELLCRGWIQRGLAPHLGSARAVFVAALIFGLLHLDPVHALFALFLGLYLGTIACWAGSTWPSILCHGLNNMLAVLFAAGLVGAPPQGVPGLVIGLALAAGALWAARPGAGQRASAQADLESRAPCQRGAASAHPSHSTLQPETRSDDA